MILVTVSVTFPKLVIEYHTLQKNARGNIKSNRKQKKTGTDAPPSDPVLIIQVNVFDSKLLPAALNTFPDSLQAAVQPQRTVCIVPDSYFGRDHYLIPDFFHLDIYICRISSA